MAELVQQELAVQSQRIENIDLTDTIGGMYRALTVLYGPTPPIKVPSLSPYSEPEPPIAEPPYPPAQVSPSQHLLCVSTEMRGLNNIPQTICQSGPSQHGPPGLLIRKNKRSITNDFFVVFFFSLPPLRSLCVPSSGSATLHFITFSFISISVSFPFGSSRPSWRCVEGQGQDWEEKKKKKKKERKKDSEEEDERGGRQ